jgi:hypothetical protein
LLCLLLGDIFLMLLVGDGNGRDHTELRKAAGRMRSTSIIAAAASADPAAMLKCTAPMPGRCLSARCLQPTGLVQQACKH